MTYIVVGVCIGVKDGACVDVCPVDCIAGLDDSALDMVYIDPQTCIDCGLCVDVCPVNAIYAEQDVPPKWAEYIPLNYWHYGLTPT